MTMPSGDSRPRIVILQRPSRIAFKRWWWDQTKGKRLFGALLSALILCSWVVLMNVGAEEKMALVQEEEEQKNYEQVDRSYKDKKAPVATWCEYECKTERIGHNSPIYSGQAICKNQHRFGLNQNGDFLLHDCEADKQEILWERNGVSSASAINFQMKKDGVFQISNKSKVLWETEPKRKIYYSEQCLDKPKLDCPYLHLRKSGMLVVNWIDGETGEWMDRPMKRIYTELFT